MLPFIEGQAGFLGNKIIISGAALVQQTGHASTTDLTLLHPLPLPPPSVPSPSSSRPPSASVAPHQASLCVASSLVDLSWSSATKFPNRLARDPAPLQSRNRAIFPLTPTTSLSPWLILSLSLRCWAPDSIPSLSKTRTRPVPRNSSNPQTRCNPSVACPTLTTIVFGCSYSNK